MNSSFRVSGAGRGFTLVELVITLALIGLISLTLFPRIGGKQGNDTLFLQRAIYEAMDSASDGYLFRFVIDPKGKLRSEILVVQEGQEEKWEKVGLKWLPESQGWKSEAAVFYIYPDGTCSPWGLTLEKKGQSIHYLVSVTGHVYEIKGSP